MERGSGSWLTYPDGAGRLWGGTNERVRGRVLAQIEWGRVRSGVAPGALGSSRGQVVRARPTRMVFAGGARERTVEIRAGRRDVGGDKERGCGAGCGGVPREEGCGGGASGGALMGWAPRIGVNGGRGDCECGGGIRQRGAVEHVLRRAASEALLP